VKTGMADAVEEQDLSAAGQRYQVGELYAAALSAPTIAQPSPAPDKPSGNPLCYFVRLGKICSPSSVQASSSWTQFR
jgi:hypothetical protein